MTIWLNDFEFYLLKYAWFIDGLCFDQNNLHIVDNFLMKLKSGTFLGQHGFRVNLSDIPNW